jgi:hypothetical protein
VEGFSPKVFQTRGFFVEGFSPNIFSTRLFVKRSSSRAFPGKLFMESFSWKAGGEEFLASVGVAKKSRRLLERFFSFSRIFLAAKTRGFCGFY